MVPECSVTYNCLTHALSCLAPRIWSVSHPPLSLHFLSNLGIHLSYFHLSTCLPSNYLTAFSYCFLCTHSHHPLPYQSHLRLANRVFPAFHLSAGTLLMILFYLIFTPHWYLQLQQGLELKPGSSTFSFCYPSEPVVCSLFYQHIIYIYVSNIISTPP